MKKILISTFCVLCFSSVGFSQESAKKEDLSPFQKYLERNMEVLEEDSARISLSTPKKKYQGGEDIPLDITLKNVGTKSFGSPNVFFYLPPDYFFDIEVTDGNGKKVQFLPTHKRSLDLSGPNGWRLLPGEKRRGTVWLNNLFNFEYDLGGSYKVIASKKFRKGNDIVTISSEPLIFEIVSKRHIAVWRSGAEDTQKE